jgi:hypothetical protein
MVYEEQHVSWCVLHVSDPLAASQVVVVGYIFPLHVMIDVLAMTMTARQGYSRLCRYQPCAVRLSLWS